MSFKHDFYSYISYYLSLSFIVLCLFSYKQIKNVFVRFVFVQHTNDHSVLRLGDE